MIPRRVRLATLLAFLLQGVFVLSARYRLSYDAYNHMFFGDHYRLNWWTLWEPRWYSGFEIVSYPPLTHQIIGLLGRVIGVDAAFALLLWLVLSAYPLAVFGFTRVFAGKTVAGYAALAAALLPSIYQAAHTFGQLPTLASGLFALFAITALNEYLHKGGTLNACLTVALFTVVMAAHHATLLFLPFALGALLVHLWLNKTLDWKISLPRLVLVGLFSALAALIVIWPFWAWGRQQAMQVPIDHPSRHNYFVDHFAPLAFFLPVYGIWIPLIPIILWKGLRRKTFGLWVAFLLLFTLGLGGTTQLPRWLFGSGWEWLTYDRFALWASWVMLPFIGRGLVLSRRTLRLSRWKMAHRLAGKGTPILFSLIGLCALISALLPTLLPTQPVQVDMQPIVDFLATKDRADWRYVTFGFGDQFAYLSRLTPATTIDGSYHSARTLPELRASGIGQIDTTYWLPGGFKLLEPVLQKLGERGVRWGFVNRVDYIPILKRYGWVYLTTLSNHIDVWENPHAVLPQTVSPPDESPWEQFSWGVFPLFSLLIAGMLSLLKLRPAAGQAILYALHSILIGLLPLALCFWYYRPLFLYNHPRVYFTYDGALIYLSDAIAACAWLAWALARGFGPAQTRAEARQPWIARPGSWLLGLCLLASLSVFWSQDWRISAFTCLQCWLVFGLFHSLQDRPDTLRSFTIGSILALVSQLGIGFWQYWTQSTAFLLPIGLNWPGDLLPAMKGASVVELIDGTRWLRAYGSLPHPNILAGVVFVSLACLVALYLAQTRGKFFTLGLIGLGVVLLVLTFSRSAWLGLAVFGLVLTLFARHFPLGRMLLLSFVALACFALMAFLLRDLMTTRLGESPVSTETFSVSARSWLAGQGLQYFNERPFSGLGIGAFILALAQRAGPGYIIEPVHNVALLAASELGLGGLVLLGGMTLSVAWLSLRGPQTGTILLFATLAGLFTISMFDHYLWSLPPGRMLFGSVLGLWAGQVAGTDHDLPSKNR